MCVNKKNYYGEERGESIATHIHIDTLLKRKRRKGQICTEKEGELVNLLKIGFSERGKQVGRGITGPGDKGEKTRQLARKKGFSTGGGKSGKREKYRDS